MLANSFRQLSKAAASRALVSQTGAQSLAPFASTAAQPSDPKTVLAILYKAGPAAEEKRLLGKITVVSPFSTLCVIACVAVEDACLADCCIVC